MKNNLKKRIKEIDISELDNIISSVNAEELTKKYESKPIINKTKVNSEYSELTISDFFTNDYIQYASYDCVRKISSFVDGLKITSRKAIYTILKNNIKEKTKVSLLKARIAEQTEYVHGQDAIAGVIIGLAQNFVGSNNINLLYPAGGYGTRINPEASADRYIYTYMMHYLPYIFSNNDNCILKNLVFEGSIIEYKYFLPIIPMILVNSSMGTAPGFKQNIYSRNIEDIISYLETRLNGKKNYNNIELKPFFNGYTGNVVYDYTTKKTEFYGTFERINNTNIIITELPIDENVSTYKTKLIDLEDKGVIKTFKDLCDPKKDKINIKVSFNNDISSFSDEQIYSMLKLISRNTEILVCVDEHNRIVEFNTIYDLLNSFYNIRLNGYELRKAELLKEYERNKDILLSKIHFIKNVVENKFIINKKPKAEIISQIESYDKYKITKIDDGYEYLLSMPVYSLTLERIKKLKEDYDEIISTIEKLNVYTPEKLWLEDIKLLNKMLKK